MKLKAEITTNNENWRVVGKRSKDKKVVTMSSSSLSLSSVYRDGSG